MTIKVAGLWHCAGRGGGDGSTISVVRTSRTLRFTGAALSSEERHGPPEIDRARRWAGYPGIASGFHEVVPRSATGRYTKTPGVTYHDTHLAAALAACRDADVVLSWGYPLHAIAPGLPEIPIVEVAQGMDDDFAIPIAKKNAPFSHFKIAVSKAVGEKAWGKKHDWAVIQNGADPMRVFPSLPDARQQLRKDWGISDDERVIVQIQRMTADKNPAAGIQAINQLQLEDLAAGLQNFENAAGGGSKIRLVLVGGGPVEQIQKIKEQIHRYTTAGRVLWVEDSWTPIGDVLAAGDVFLLASESEGWSIAVMEAMLAGIPCVLSSNWSHLEMMKQFGQIAVFVPLHPKPMELAAAIYEALKQTSRRQLAYEVVKTYFTVPAVTARYEEAIEEALRNWRFHRRHPKVWLIPDDPKRSSTNVNLPPSPDSSDNATPDGIDDA